MGLASCIAWNQVPMTAMSAVHVAFGRRSTYHNGNTRVRGSQIDPNNISNIVRFPSLSNERSGNWWSQRLFGSNGGSPPQNSRTSSSKHRCLVITRCEKDVMKSFVPGFFLAIRKTKTTACFAGDWRTWKQIETRMTGDWRAGAGAWTMTSSPSSSPSFLPVSSKYVTINSNGRDVWRTSHSERCFFLRTTNAQVLPL